MCSPLQYLQSSADGIQQLLPGEAVGGEQPSAEAAVSTEQILLAVNQNVPLL